MPTSHSDVSGYAILLGNILNGNAAGFFVMVVVMVALTVAVHALWKVFVRELENCRNQHLQCLEDNQDLAQAILDLGRGNTHAARARAKVVIDRSQFPPGSSGPSGNPPN